MYFYGIDIYYIILVLPAIAFSTIPNEDAVAKSFINITEYIKSF